MCVVFFKKKKKNHCLLSSRDQAKMEDDTDPLKRMKETVNNSQARCQSS